MLYDEAECARIESKIALNGKNVKKIFDNVIVDIDCMIEKLKKLINKNYYENSDINMNSNNNDNCKYTHTSEYNGNINGKTNNICKAQDKNCYPCIELFANDISCMSISNDNTMNDTNGSYAQDGSKYYDKNNVSNSNSNDNVNDDSVDCLIRKNAIRKINNNGDNNGTLLNFALVKIANGVDSIVFNFHQMNKNMQRYYDYG